MDKTRMEKENASPESVLNLCFIRGQDFPEPPAQKNRRTVWLCCSMSLKLDRFELPAAHFEIRRRLPSFEAERLK